MKTLRFVTLVAIVAAATAALAAVQGNSQTARTSIQSTPVKPNKTTHAALSQAAPGVGVMVNLHGGSFSLVNSMLYHLSDGDAAAQFTNRFNGQVSCIDQSGAACDVGDAPPAPAPDPTQTTLVAQAQACTFLRGGALQPSIYTQAIYISPVPYNYTWKGYIYNYDVVPGTAPVPPLTAWRFVQFQPTNSSGSLQLTISGEVINELVAFPDPGVPMYVFMTGGLVSNLHLTINNNPLAVTSVTQKNCPGCMPGQRGSVDFTFYPNVGTMGSALSYVKPGDARTILNSDSYSANDNGGSGGEGLEMTTFTTQPVKLAPGAYSLQVTGTSAGISFMVSGSVQAISPTCSIQ